MEKESIGPRQYHESTGRKVRSDKFLTEEVKKAKARRSHVCRMAPEEPEDKVSTTAPPILEQCGNVQEAAKVYGAHAAAAKTRGLSSECV